jgi:light-regulated signal transduction histidine kinase (bacteriophytochrome)
MNPKIILLVEDNPSVIKLGLAVSKKPAEPNDLRIEVQSEPGIGSTFKVYLPVKQLNLR